MKNSLKLLALSAGLAFTLSAQAQSTLYTVKDSVNLAGQPALAFFFPNAQTETGMDLWEDHIEDHATGKPEVMGTQVKISGVSFEAPLTGPFVSTSDFVQQRDGLMVFFVFEDSTGVVTEPSNPNYWVLEKRLLSFVSEILVEQLGKMVDEREDLLDDHEDEVKKYVKKRENLLEDIEENRAEIRQKEQKISIEKNMQERIVGQIESTKAQMANAETKEQRKVFKKSLKEYEDNLEDSQDEEKDLREDIFDLESEIREWETEISLAKEKTQYYTQKSEEDRAELLRLEERVYEAKKLVRD